MNGYVFPAKYIAFLKKSRSTKLFTFNTVEISIPPVGRRYEISSRVAEMKIRPYKIVNAIVAANYLLGEMEFHHPARWDEISPRDEILHIITLLASITL